MALSDFWRTTHRRNSLALSDGYVFGGSLSARDENSGFVVSTRARLALGVLVGALTLGKATPYLVNGSAVRNWRTT